MIDVLEIRNSNRVLIGVIDNATSIIWHSKYYGTGDFEIYVVCTAETAAILVAGNFVTRADERDVGIIENVRITYTASEGRMITASGRFAKSILDRRIIYSLSGYSVTAKVLSGNVETAVRTLINENAISCNFDTARNMPQIALGASAGITKTIVDIDGNETEKQVTYKGLLEYIENLMQEYGIGSYMKLNPDTLKLEFYAFEGKDRSIGNGFGGGETVTWNELVKNSNFANETNWVANGTSLFSVADNTATITPNGDTYPAFPGIRQTDRTHTVEHIYLIALQYKGFSSLYMNFAGINNVIANNLSVTNFNDVKYIFKATGDGSLGQGLVLFALNASNNLYFKNVYLFDLTLMFGAGNEPGRTDDPRIALIDAYADQHPEYNTGTVVTTYEPIIFSQDFDNILSSEYVKDVSTEKNTAIVAGEGDGIERFVSVFKSGASGISRREKYIDASSNSKTYRDEEEVEHTLTDAEYNKVLLSAGKADIATYTITETFSGNIDLSNSVWKYGENADYYLGDIFSIQDNGIGLYINARLIGITETQDENGYNIAGEFGL